MALKSQPKRLGAAVSAVLALLVGCGEKKDGVEQPNAETAPNIVQAGAPGEGSTTLSAAEFSDLEIPSFTDADVRFMQGMIHHHPQAPRMPPPGAKRPPRQGAAAAGGAHGPDPDRRNRADAALAARPGSARARAPPRPPA